LYVIIFRGLFQKHFMRQIPREVQVNLARLASQWEDRINRAIEGMKKQALKYAHDELATSRPGYPKLAARPERFGE
jgi:hypothetical protein